MLMLSTGSADVERGLSCSGRILGEDQALISEHVLDARLMVYDTLRLYGGKPERFIITKELLNLARSAWISVALRRSFSTSLPVVQKAVDPIQKLFLDKIKEYDQKSKAAGGKLLEASTEIQRELDAELDKLKKMYGGDTADLSKFPSFHFEDPVVDPINMQK
ncbi:hypothetical protein QYM36_015217 [Artemia franciscana]|uniref:ATP synthase-coupling factor 6, mitochondrial n=1 Tax=Artemia franciscana TaxID=6661 RepID=A0AA88HKM7_ARTSF|nr:hypothetical protein QYM36_015217 [Artemia franciscana]